MPLGKIARALHFLEAADGALELERAAAGGVEDGGFGVRGGEQSLPAQVTAKPPSSSRSLIRSRISPRSRIDA